MALTLGEAVAIIYFISTMAHKYPVIRPIALVCTIFTIAQLGTYDTNPVYGLIKTATGNMNGGLGYAATYAWIYSLVVLLIIGIAFLIFRDRKEKKKGVRA